MKSGVVMSKIPNFDIMNAPLSGVHLVEASAGTGKTWNIEAIVVRLLAETRPKSGKRLKPRDVLVVTFTEAATQELRERIINRLNQVYLALKEMPTEHSDPFLAGCVNRYGKSPALRTEVLNHLEACKQEFDEASIYTIHGFANAVINEYRFETGLDFDVEIQQDTGLLVEELISDFWRKKNIELSKLPGNKFNSAINDWFKKDRLKNQFLMFIQQPVTRLHLPDTPPGWTGKSIPDCYLEMVKYLEEIESIWSKERAEIRAELASTNIPRFNYSRDFEKWEIGLLEFFNNPFSDDKFDYPTRFTPRFFDLKGAKTTPEHRVYQIIQDAIDRFLWLGQTDIRTSLISLRETYRESRRDKKLLIYEDLLTTVSDALEATDQYGNPSSLKLKLLNRFKVALIDEFQDTDPIQFNIFNHIYIENETDEDGLLYLIGDPKQAIYKFRGADLNTYLRVRDQVDSQFSLGVNFRSTESMVEGVNRFFSKEHAFINPKLDYHPVSANQSEDPFVTDVDVGTQALRFIQMGKFEITNKSAADTLITRWIGYKIAALLKSSQAGNSYILEKDGSKRAIGPGDIAILVRIRKQAKMFREYLNSINIPSVETGDSNIFDSRDAYLMSILLECMLNPGLTRKIRALLGTEYFGKTMDEIDDWQSEDLRWSDLIQNLNHGRILAENQGILTGLRFIMDKYEIELTLIQLQMGERHLTNLRHLTELMYEEERTSHRNFSGLVNWLKRKRLSESANNDTYRLRLESDSDRVQVNTMHSSKGLEYPIVFAPYMWESCKKPIKNGGYVFSDGDGKPVMDIDEFMHPYSKNQYHMDMWEDSIRLAYVTMTRSKYRCYVPFPLHKDSIQSSLFGAQLGTGNHLKYLNRDKKASYPEFVGEDLADSLLLLRLLQIQAEVNSDVMTLESGYFDRVTYSRESDDQPELKARVFDQKMTKSLIPERNISSYSSIQRKYEVVGQEPDELMDEDNNVDAQGISSDTENVTDSGRNSIFTFPKGAETGNLWHEIFELIDFSDPSDHEMVIKACCEKHGFDYNRYGHVLTQMVESTLGKNLSRQGSFKLADIRMENTLREMEFLLSYRETQMQQFLSELDYDDNSLSVENIFANANIDISRDSDVSYLLTGLIDLVIEHEGKFYILDYKSNFLGNTVQSYSNDILEHNIRQSKYDMQYHLYCVALNKYLSRRISNYSYDKHFGGVFYLYLRGINSMDMSGVFFDRPDSSLLKKLIDWEGDHGK